MVDRQTIDAKILSRMFLAGAKNLEAKKEWINELNVFPVPDGDTGTNMTMTRLFRPVPCVEPEVTQALFFPSFSEALPREPRDIKKWMQL